MNKNREKIELKVHKPKAPRMTSIEENIQLARLQQAVTSSALYERKHNQKALKVVTVAAYILFVSMAAITLSFYYIFIWDPSTKPMPPRSPACDNKVVIPESLAIRLANSTEITAENFFKNIFRSYQSLQNKDNIIQTINETNVAAVVATTANITLATIIATAMATPINNVSDHSSTTTPSTILNQEITTGPSLMMLKNHQDDDDDTEGDIDYEASGNKQINWNDTTIQLDGDKDNL